jgi:hypothetical protein
MSYSSLLTLSAIGLPPYSARGLRQTLAPIGGATNLRRTVNGALVDLADPVFRKYESTISGEDVDPPALDLVYPGRTLTVGCIAQLAVQTSGTDPITEEDLGRVPVSGSMREAGGFVFYRPQLVMLVTGWDISEDEWERGVTWSLTLEEV